MTKKEKDLKVLEALGLKVGDRISFISNEVVNIQGVYEIRENDTQMCLKRLPNGFSWTINCLIEYDWKKLEKPTKYMKCNDFYGCDGCPIFKYDYLACGRGQGETLEEKYNGARQDLDKLKTEIFGEEK